MHDYLYSFLGGSLIGLSATFFLLTNGRISGISGIISGAIFSRDRIQFLFFLGLLGSGMFHYFSARAQAIDFGAPIYVYIVAGLLVGFGTRLGSGCTSGHGICGIARFSRRSLIATVIFMLVGIVTATSISWIRGIS